ncbi:MAG: glycosyltransferase, partial [Campylobacterales bacterium]|nr:glycosyltransferase [Campylobacterales bacterium]
GIESNKFYPTYHLGNTHLLEAPSITFEQTKKSLLYIGTLTWEANVDGLVWFLEEIWYGIKIANPEICLSIVGKNPDKRIIDLTKNDSSIDLVGFVDDLEEYYSSSRIFISPLRFGSGIKVKVVNALYRGIPTVTTSIGVEGLDVVHEKEVMVADNPIEFIECVNRLMADENLWQSIVEQSRGLMREKYTWESVFENVEKAIYG